jgi:hypothetical protein
VHNIDDALARISHAICEARSIFIEVLPPVLVLHLKRFLYDAAADGTVKISKSIEFSPELDIPLGKNFFLFPPS